MKLGMELKRTKLKSRHPNQQEGTESAKSPWFKERQFDGFKKIITSAFPTFMRFYGIVASRYMEL